MNAMWGSLMAILVVALFVAILYWRRWEHRARRAERDLDNYITDLLTMTTYEVLAMRTAMPQDDSAAINHAILGMGSEAGELMTHWKAHLYYKKPLDLDYMRKELGDELWFLTRAARALGMSLSEVAEANIKKLRLRYPGQYSRADALARADETPSRRSVADALDEADLEDRYAGRANGGGQ